MLLGMPFEAGTRLGPYEIIAPLGAGGMGEVYRGRDTRLDRIVAIKVLTGSLATDSESRQRFEHEARAAAALNDPHICTIHDVGRHGDLDYLVFEYLEGETLAERLRRPPALSIDDAIGIAIQIGEALDRAHRAGIVHRDLKPGNVMLVRRSGPSSAPDVKLLDFGLAAWTIAMRPRELEAAASAVTTMAPSLETRPSPPTAPSGFGTVPYMAPEQFEGEAGDPRTDIFAFGCVLYEMLAGHRAFDGSSTMTVIAAIMHAEPPPIAALQSTHPLLDHVMRRCLEKDRERRWQNIGDVSGELRWIRDHPIPVAAAATAPGAAPPQALPRRAGRLAITVAALGVVLATAATMLGVRAIRRSEAAPASPPFRFEIATPPTDDPSVALSPDGAQIAFVANQDRVPMLWVRALDATENRALPGTQGARFPFWSPDGRTIGFFADDKLKRVDVAGGTPLVVADAPNARGGTWNSDGVILFAPGVSAPIMRVSTRGGSPEPVTRTNKGSGPSHRWPQFLPDGKRFLFSSALGTPDTNGVYIGTLDKGSPVRVSGDANGRFAAPDKLLTIKQGALQAYSFDAAAGRMVSGEPVVIAQGFPGTDANAAFATSETGVLAYRAAATAQARQLVWVDRQGNLLHPIGDSETDSIASPELSADEQSVAVVLQRSGGNDIWTIELARNLPHRMTNGPPASAHPLWDPDGQHVVYYSRQFGSGAPARQAVNGGKAEPLFAKAESGTPLSWTHDRAFILLRRESATTGADLIAVATTSGPREAPREAPRETPRDVPREVPREVVVAQSPNDETEGQFSPDGKWVAFVSNESGHPEVYVQSFPEARARTQISTAGGTQVRWSVSGNEIFYVAPDGKMMTVSMTLGGASPGVKPPTPLFQTRLATGINVLGNKPQYAVARDGRFLLNTLVESPSAPIVVSVNWMKKLAK
jgi:Tol biopolymer transport system component/tRNA A-37 threonylcarbamoyl transferase component Bud32